MKKPLIVLLLLSLVWTSAWAQPASNATNITLIVDNQSHVALNAAKVRINKGRGDEWTELGNISPKSETKGTSILLKDGLDAAPGLLKFQFGSSKKWMIGTFSKPIGSTAITITIKKSATLAPPNGFDDSAFDKDIPPSSKAAPQSLLSIKATNSSDRSAVNPKEAPAYIKPLGDYKNQWSATCKAANYANAGGMCCYIYSDPEVVFVGVGEGLSATIGWGDFESNLSPTDLVALPPDQWRYWSAAFVIHMTMPQGYFGSNFALGAGFGGGQTGRYYSGNSCNH